MKRKTFVVLVLGVVVLAFFLSWAKTINVPLKAGGLVQIKPASFLGSIYSARCIITYKAKGNNGAKIDLLQTFWKWPITVIPSTNDDILLCLYDG